MQVGERFKQTRVDKESPYTPDRFLDYKLRDNRPTIWPSHTDDFQTIDNSQQSELLLRMMNNMVNEIQSLREEVVRLKDLMHDIVENQDLPVSDDIPDNYDMAPEQVKELILEKIGLDKPFYPSDLAEEYGLDYDVVLEAVDILRQEGRIAE